MRASLHNLMSTYRTFIAHNWAMIAFGATLTFGSSFGQTYFVSVFNPFMRDELTLTDGELGGLYALGTLAAAATMIWLGKFLDTLTIEKFVLIPTIGLTCACIWTMIAPGAAALFVSFFLLRLFGQGLMTQTSNITMGRLYDKQRGKALSLSAMGLTVGAALLPFASLISIERIGWRATYGASGLFVIAILLPVSLALLRHGRTQRAARAGEDAKLAQYTNDTHALPDPVHHWTRAQMLRDRRFYLIVFAVLIAPFTVTALLWNQFYIADIKGWDRQWMASMLSVLAVAQIIGTLVAGPLVDKLSARRLIPLLAIPFALAIIAVLTISHPVGATLMMACLGAGGGGGIVAGSAVWPELYGTRYLGAIKSLTGALMVMSTAAAPALLGVLIDAGMSFSGIMTVLLGYVAAAAFAAVAVKPDRPPATHSTDPCAEPCIETDGK